VTLHCPDGLGTESAVVSDAPARACTARCPFRLPWKVPMTSNPRSPRTPVLAPDVGSARPLLPAASVVIGATSVVAQILVPCAASLAADHAGGWTAVSGFAALVSVLALLYWTTENRPARTGGR
jgi:hypothetical protein